MTSQREIVLIEDERSWCDLLRDQLTPVGIGLVWLSNPSKAIAHIKAMTGPAPYCFIVDISLRPGDGGDKSGVRILEAIRERDRATPVLFVTRFGEENPDAQQIAGSHPATVFALKERFEHQAGVEIPRLVAEATSLADPVRRSRAETLLRAVGIGSILSITASIIFLELRSLSAMFMTVALTLLFALFFWVWHITKIRVLPPVVCLFGVLGGLLLALTAAAKLGFG